MPDKRETTPADWKAIDHFFDEAYTAFSNGQMSYDQYRAWITHFIGLCNNQGIDAVVDGMKNSLDHVSQNGWSGS